MNKLSVEEVNFNHLKVLVRVDFNVPLDENLNITDDRRIVAALPTIERLTQQEAKVILISHLGRPKGKRKPEFSLAPVAKRLSQLMGKNVRFVDDCIGPEVKKQIDQMDYGDVLLLENVRFYKEETENNPEFAAKLAELADIFVNDAFGTAHRAHASTVGVAKYFEKRLAGYLMQKEIDYLGNAISNPARPFTAILGGAKISGKIDVIENLFDKVDTLIIGGGMVFTFLKAMDYNIGKSLLEEEKLSVAREILKKAEKSNVQFLLPVDVVLASEFSNDAEAEVCDVDNISENKMGLDIGPKTISLFKSEIVRSKTVVWNGPMGVFEFDKFARGTKAIAEALAEATLKGAITIVGGGDSAAAVKKFNFENKISHVSTGGGASLEFLEGKILPGVDVLSDA